jgi:phenylpropionate dioxygenase-like ring-hydroxylating dioxygenase large terminal subunit
MLRGSSRHQRAAFANFWRRSQYSYVETSAIDVGTGYGRNHQPSYDRDLTEVGPGTRAGELLRRYWHPFARIEEATELPTMVRLLGEDLVLFRDRSGRPGLLVPRCCHRGTSLLYGQVEEEGIRCCYHGWLFDIEGSCLDQPCEPDRGRNRSNYRQMWFPVVEYNGLIFAYLGPPEKKPVFPRYDIFENMSHDERIVIVDHFAFGGPVEAPCNWFQTHENTMDLYHVFILHNAISGPQFHPDLQNWPTIEWHTTAVGVKAIADRKLADGRELHRITEVRFPTIRVVPTPTLLYTGTTNNLSWAVPIDDTHTKVFAMVRIPKDQPAQGLPVYAETKTWFELTDDEHQRYPGDYEAQVSQGAITAHSEEHLSATDRGVSMVRRMFKQQLEIMDQGGDPLGVTFDPENAIQVLEAGNYFR